MAVDGATSSLASKLCGALAFLPPNTGVQLRSSDVLPGIVRFNPLSAAFQSTPPVLQLTQTGIALSSSPFDSGSCHYKAKALITLVTLASPLMARSICRSSLLRSPCASG